MYTRSVPTTLAVTITTYIIGTTILQQYNNNKANITSLHNIAVITVYTARICIQAYIIFHWFYWVTNY